MNRIKLLQVRTSIKVQLLVSLAFVFFFVFSSQAARRYAVANGNWDATSTWSATSGGTGGASIPVAGDTIYIGEGAVGYTVTIPSGGSVDIGHIFIGSGTVTSSSSLTLASNTSLLNVSGNVTINKPAGNAINALAVNAGTVKVAGSITLAGNSTQSTRVARITITNGLLEINGDLVFITGAAQNNSLEMSGGGGTLVLKGLWNATVGSLNSSTTSTVKFQGTAAQTIPTGIGNFNHIEINNAAGVNLSGALTATLLKGNIVIGNTVNSIFSTNNFNLAFSAGKSLTVAEGSTLNAGTSVLTMGTTGAVNMNGICKTANTAGFSGATASAISSTNTPTITLGGAAVIEYNNNTATTQTITGRTDYASLVLSGNAPKTLGAATTVNKNFSASGGNLADGGRTLTVKGNLDNNITISGTGKVILNGGGAVHTLTGTGTFTNLELNDGNHASLLSNQSITGTLTFTAGKLFTNGFTLTLGVAGSSAGTITTAGDTKYVVGTLRRYIPNGIGSTVAFPVGDATTYSPVNLVFTGSSLAGSGYVEVSSAAATPAVESGINQSKYVNRKWILSNAGVTGFSAYSSTFTFTASDLQGSPNTAAFVVRRLSGGTWYNNTSSNQSTQSTTATGLTGFGDFYIGESEPAPAISLQPLSDSICKGDNASFTASATASFTPNVKWQRSTNGTTWTDITANLDAGTTYSGFTSETVSLAGSTTAMNGYKYRAVFYNINGSTNTTEAILTVEDKPVSVSISSSDADNTICVGNSVTFTATPTNGGSAPQYQWSINGVDVTGETGATFTSTSLANGDAVRVVLTSSITPCASGNPATSNAIVTTVVAKPTATIGSTNSPICEGQNAVFTITGTSGATITYTINGGTTATKVLTGGSATITVNAVSNHTTLNVTSVSIAACTESLSLSETVIVNKKTYSTTDITACNSYTWNGVTFTNSGSYKDTLTNADNCDSIATLNLTINKTSISSQPTGGSVCKGDSLTLSVAGAGPGTLTYQWVYNGADISGATNASYKAADTGTYSVKVTGDCGTVSSANVQVTFKAPTTITTEPISGLVCPKSTLSIAATGTGTITYQWFKDEAVIPGATATSYVVTEAGSYKAVATALCGSDTSNAAVITLRPVTLISTEPTGGTICADSSMLLTVSASGDGSVSYQWRRNGSDISGATFASYTASLTGTYSVIATAGCGNDTSINAVVGSKLPTTITTQPQSGAICVGGNVLLSVAATGEGTLAYQWFKDGSAISGATQTTYTATQTGSYAVIVNGGCGFALSTSAVVTNATATLITAEPQGTSICTGGSGLLSVTAVGQGTLSYQWRLNGTNISGANASTLPVTQTGTYSVIVSGACGNDTSVNASVTVSTATGITTQPTGGAICLGASITMNVVATGQGTITYQWKKDGVDITGATASTYIANLAGTYSVAVTAACGSITSSNAIVTLKTTTSITTQPANATICSVGGSATLSVVAAGNTLTYQWRKDSVNISGATAASYLATTIGTYSVVVTGECGTVTSSNAVVTLKTPTSITKQPVSGGICSGGTYTLTVVATGDGVLTYQWRRNGTNISGATAASYIATQTGTYTVVVTGTCGSVTSTGATVSSLSPGTYSVFPENPPAETGNANVGVEVGNKFYSTVNGYITALRFLKPSYDGNYTVSLWDASTKARLATAEVISTSKGWITVPLANPVAITANKVYVSSYYSPSGYLSEIWHYLDTPIVRNYLVMPDGPSVGGNGVRTYGSSSYPELYGDSQNNHYNINFFADVVFTPCLAPDVTGPVVTAKLPVANSENVPVNSTVTATFNEAVDPTTINNQSVLLVNSSNVNLSASVSYDAIKRKVTLTPTLPLAYGNTYRVVLRGGTSTAAIKDVVGNRMAEYFWDFKTPAEAVTPPDQGKGGPVLILSSSANPFSKYYAEILRAEGINSFVVRDINAVTADTLNRYDVVLLGDFAITSSHVTLLTNWVTAGGTLVSFKPDTKLYSLLGIAAANGTLSDKYLQINTASEQGAGIVGETIQYHGIANLFTTTSASSLATLYSTSAVATSYPAVTTNLVGNNNGKAIAFAFDLARSIVYMRQGNPAWAGQKRDGQGEVARSDDMFFGNSATDPQPDWIDFNKIQIPQADEQQHFLSNLIIQGMMHRKPLPRFWILPNKHKAAIIMTGDDHGNSGTAGRFQDQYNLGNNTAEDVKNWRAVRSTSYIYAANLMTADMAKTFTDQGFEIGVHLNTLCNPYNSTTLQLMMNEQLNGFSTAYPSIPAPTTHRTHCIVWSDWASKPKIEILNGIRLNTDYYYWPASWVKDRPGMFTGSGMPMRFADLDGTLLDNYQVTTQMTDESDITLPGFVNTLLDNALGAKGYYGAFCANFHTDKNSDTDPITLGSRAIVNAAVSRGVPVISAKQMLTWLDGRNNSAYQNMAWNGSQLTFTIKAATGAYNLQGMMPINLTGGKLQGIAMNGSPVTYTVEVIKGMEYAFFTAVNGSYVATYLIDKTAPEITNIKATPNIDGSATITWTTDEDADSKVLYGTTAETLSMTGTNTLVTSKYVTDHAVNLPGLTPGATYYFRVVSSDANGNNNTSPSLVSSPLNFTMPGTACFFDNTTDNFLAGTTGDSTYITSVMNGEIKLKPGAAADFAILPAEKEWKSFAWTGGTSTINAGSIVVNGARYNTQPSTATFGPGTSLEFVATFTGPYQAIGFGAGSDATGAGGIFNGENGWLIFSTDGTGTTLKASTSTGPTDVKDFVLTGSFIGTANRYRIEWKTNNIDYFINDILVRSEAATISTPMRPAISDYLSTAPAVSVDWINTYPYKTAGNFRSRVFDAGVLRSWKNVLWDAQVPVGTTLQISYRRGNTPIPDSTWSGFASIPESNTILDVYSRYIQYQVAMSTNNANITPVLKSIGISCANVSELKPDVTKSPSSVTKCTAESALFTSTAIGVPAPQVKWQYSVDNGTSWTDLTGASKDSLTLVITLADHNKKIRAIWSNTSGSDTSDAAMLIVGTASGGTLAVANICNATEISLKYTGATGIGPYSLQVNDTTYNNIQSDVAFTTGMPLRVLTESIWSAKVTGEQPAEIDPNGVELGMKFKANIAGRITGIRFYKGIGNTGTHTGSLWSADGTLLAKATFTNETATGWQQVKFSSPVTITPGITYIASYYAPNGNYSYTGGVFTANVDNSTKTLTGLRASDVGGNGLYRYGGGFPNQVSGGSGSYYVDVLFENSLNRSTFVLKQITSGIGCVTVANPIYTLNANLTPPSLAFTKSTLACEENKDGTLTLTGSNGNLPYSFSIDNGITFQQSGSYTGLGAGTYPVKLKDAGNCAKDTIVVISSEKAVWTGAVSSDWHTAANWNTLSVPTSTTNVIIPFTANECIISATDATVSGIHIATGASFRAINNRKLSVVGTCATLPVQ